MTSRSSVLLVFFLFLTLGLAGQTIPLSGMWQGNLTQNEGGYRSDYDFEVYFKAGTNELSGRTYVRTPGIYGEMSFTGQRFGAVYHLKELELVYSRKPGELAWCYKTMQLRLVKRGNDWYLEGPWQGVSEFGACIPGWIVLKRVVPQA